MKESEGLYVTVDFFSISAILLLTRIKIWLTKERKDERF